MKKEKPSYYRSWFFDNLAYVYDLGVNLLFSEGHLRYANEIYEEIPPHSKIIADFGCGTGELLHYLARQNKEAQLIGIDLSSRMLDRAKKKLPARIALYHENIEHMHFYDASFDCIILRWVLHEMPIVHIQKALKEAVRVLKPGGSIIIFDFHPAKPTPLLRLHHLLFERYIKDFYTFNLLSFLRSVHAEDLRQKLLWDGRLQLVTARF